MWRTALVMIALAPTADAGFNKFTWALTGDPNGSGTVTNSLMQVTSSDAGLCSGNPLGATWFETVATANATITAHLDFDNQDTGFSYWHFEKPIYVVNGTVTVIGDSNTSFDFSTDFSFTVKAGDTFGFGSWAIDCQGGPSVSDYTQFEFEPDTWTDLGFALAGTSGAPQLAGVGTLKAGFNSKMTLLNGLPNTTAYLVASAVNLSQPFQGGILVPHPIHSGILVPLPTGPIGRIVISQTWPAGVTPGVDLYLQYWIIDPGGPAGYAASNALEVKTE